MAAFVDLLQERGYDALSVEDVVSRANIGRSTLYAHFGGLEGMLGQSLTGPSTQLAAIVDRPVSIDDAAALLAHFKEQRQRNKAFLVHPIRGVWVRRLAELIEPRLVALARDQGRPQPALAWSFIACQVAEAQIALVANWLTLRLTVPPAIIAEALIATTRAAIDGLAPRGRPD
jgi:AcrR family transcriptional regulator